MIILGTNSIKDTGYDVANSLRFNSGSSDRLNRTLGTPTNNLKWTYSFWIKRSKLGEEVAITEAINNSQNKGLILFRSDDQLEIIDLISDSYAMQKKTNRKFRDVSAWYHIVFSNDSTVGSPDLKIYVNGVEETSLATDNEYSQNQAGSFNSALANHIGASASSRFSNCYFSEFVFIDGQALDPTSFGEFDSDSPTIWKPIDVSGLTFGNNGFYLDFEDSSALGNDAAGSNNFTVNNLTAIDQTTDTCTNNFATMNPLETSPNGVVFSEGNLEVVGSGGNGGRITLGTFALNSGKWWCEVKMLNVNGSYPIVGIIDSQSSLKMDAVYFVDSGQDANNRSGYAVFSNSDIYNNGDNNFGDFGTTYTTNDIIGVGLDMDASTPTLTFQKNGSNEVTVTTEVPPSGFYNFPAIGFYFANAKVSVNFGNPAYTISSGNTDANGYGNFEYAPKSGYYACNTKNLAEFG